MIALADSKMQSLSGTSPTNASSVGIYHEQVQIQVQGQAPRACRQASAKVSETGSDTGSQALSIGSQAPQPSPSPAFLKITRDRSDAERLSALPDGRLLWQAERLQNLVQELHAIDALPVEQRRCRLRMLILELHPDKQPGREQQALALFRLVQERLACASSGMASTAHSASSPYRCTTEDWFRDRLHQLAAKQPRSVDAKIQADAFVLALVQKKTVFDELIFLNLSSRAEFKEKSRGGTIRFNRRFVDIGNWRYSVIFNKMIKAAEEIEDPTCLSFFQQLTSSYPTCRFDADYTDNSISMKGDVIECILATCNLRGPAVDKNSVQDRKDVHDTIKRLGLWLDSLLHWVFDGEDVWGQDLPSPTFFHEQLQSAFGSDRDP